ncbi:MAG: UvrD-helicase domain-containing protein [Acidobacteria bacterium]|nr:UvrD-helicase domain-containing protein [Acidobacteriota bacterium]
MIDLSTLNPRQRDAVTHESGPLLVLAGAGSGKTRVITYRIANLVGNLGVDPRSILAVTFTNKAANEMLERVSAIVPGTNGRPTVGTFHSTAVRALRRYGDLLGYTRSFVIYDTSDQLALLRRVLRESGLSDEQFQPRAVLSRISKAKNLLLGPAEFEKRNTDFFGQRIAGLYRSYQAKLREFDAMDFDDLIGNWIELLRDHESVRDETHARIQHLLIDEYQDTNHAQYTLVKLLAGEKGNVSAVGDEDQSIYRFRGADIENILRFEEDFPGARIVKLEQNYRSTGNILDAAIGVVSNNVARRGKTLFTDAGRGEPVRVVQCETDRDEAQFVVREIDRQRNAVSLQEFAVLFRTNAQSRPFEEELLKRNLPYTVVGGTRFYDRAEVKDILAYLRLIVRPHDTPSLERIINVPARGIGDTTWRAIDNTAKDESTTPWALIEGDLPFLAERARKAVREFRETVEDLRRAAESNEGIGPLLEYVVLRTGYRKALLESKDPQDEARLDNIAELVNSANEFAEANPGASIASYLDSVTLMADVDAYDAKKGVTLMTLHAAKGLEFRVVFLAGMEEGILPHAQSKDDFGDIEEERRLCYVGMTRARERLYCLHCFQRRVYGQMREQEPSQFIAELPENAIETMRNQSAFGSSYGSGYGSSRGALMPGRETPLRGSQTSFAPRGGSRKPVQSNVGNVMGFFKDAPVAFDPGAIKAARATEASVRGLTRGMRVRHEQFGDGVILKIEGEGDNAKLTVFFDRAGSKKFVAKFVKLEKR